VRWGYFLRRRYDPIAWMSTGTVLVPIKLDGNQSHPSIQLIPTESVGREGGRREPSAYSASLFSATSSPVLL
jgi:hypothetical protein